MDCAQVRARLTARQPLEARAQRHLLACAACQRFGERLDVAHELLRAHHARLEPDAGFSSRVAARLRPVAAPDPLGWAALRLLPASLAVVAALLVVCLSASPSPDALVAEATTQHLVEWLAASSEAAP